MDANLEEFLNGRHIATIATENADGSIHMTAVWYIFEAGKLYVATSSKTKKARNLAERRKASLMIDSRNPGKSAELLRLELRICFPAVNRRRSITESIADI